MVDGALGVPEFGVLRERACGWGKAMKGAGLVGKVGVGVFAAVFAVAVAVADRLAGVGAWAWACACALASKANWAWLRQRYTRLA